jgi:SET family sugar efflux transporter-like MFS transporter
VTETQEVVRPPATGKPARPAGLLAARQAAPLAGAVGAYGVFSAFLYTTTSLFLTSAVDAAPLLVGLFFAVRGAISIAVNQGVGSLSDRLPDRRWLLVIGGVGGALNCLCFAVFRDYLMVLITGTVFFAIGSLSFSQLFAYASEFATTRGRPVTVFTSTLRAVFSASWVIGPPAGLFLLARYGFGPLYLVAGGLALVTAAAGWSLPRLPAASRPAASDDRSSRRADRPQAFRALPARTWLLLGAVVALGVVNQMYGIDIALYVTKTLNLDVQLVGWMAGLGAALEIPIMIVAGRLAQRVGKHRLLLASAVGATAFFCLLPLARTAALLLALQVLNAAWTAVAMSIPMVMIQEESPSGVGTGTALYSSAFMTAGLLAGVFTGVTASVTGFGGVFWVCAGLSAAAAGMLLARSGQAAGAIGVRAGGR